MRAASVASRVEGEAASVASGAEGMAVSVVRDAIEGVTAPVLLATELARYGPGNIQFRDINTFRKQLDYLDQQFSDHCVPDKTWYYGGRVAGDTACVVAGAGMTVVGISTIIGGFTVTAGGVLATATGVVAVIGVPAIAVSGVAVAEGALVTAGGIGIIYASGRNLFDDVPKFMQEISKSGGNAEGSFGGFLNKKIFPTCQKTKYWINYLTIGLILKTMVLFMLEMQTETLG